MTEPRQHAHPRHPGSLDALLLRLPTPGGEPAESEWSARLERTLQQVKASAAATTATDPEQDLLRTPLPVEAGEPEPVDPFSFEVEQGAFYDPLRAPLKSGEHAPVRLEQRALSELRSTPSAKAVPLAAARAPSWAYWLSGGVGVLAAAAALVLAVRSREPLDLGQAVAQQAATPAPTPRPDEKSAQIPAQKPVQKPEENAELSERAHAEPVAESATAVVTSKVAQRPAAAGTKHAGGASKLSPSEKEPPQALEEEPLVPAAGPSNLTERPSVGAINAALANSVPAAQRCLTPETASASVRIVFQSNGSVQNVQVVAPKLSSESAACIQRAFSRARVEAFAQPRAEVTRMISLPNP